MKARSSKLRPVAETPNLTHVSQGSLNAPYETADFYALIGGGPLGMW